MLPIQTILHPTDFSERSAHAFGLACALSRDYEARLIVLHVVEIPTAYGGEGLLPPPVVDYDALREKLEETTTDAPGVRIEQHLVDGIAGDEILALAEQKHVDLIVMGTHGRRGLSRFLTGSVAEQVLRRAACPVVTVRAPVPQTAASDKPADEAEALALS